MNDQILVHKYIMGQNCRNIMVWLVKTLRGRAKIHFKCFKANTYFVLILNTWNQKGCTMSSGMTAILHIFFLMRILEPKLFVALVKALNQWLRCAFGNVLQLIPSEQFAKLSPLWFSFIPTVITFSNLRNDPVGSILENKTKKQSTPFES